MTKNLLVKLAVGAGALALFGYLFVRSLEDTRSEPYTVAPRHLETWALALAETRTANEPLLVLRPSPELAAGLFKQIFARAMESLTTPVSPSMPLVLRGEFDRVLGDQMTPETLLEAARAAGLDAAAPSPRCLVHRHISEQGGVRQAFLVWFDLPALERFRRQVGLDPGALSPVLLVAGSGADFNTWLPQRVAGADECLAPVDVGG